MRKFLSVLVLLSVVHSFVFSQSARRLADSEIAKWIEQYIGHAEKFDHFSGVVLVAHKNKTVFARAYGMANYELNVPNKLDTKFRIGSVSKTFTAAAVTKLYQAHKIHLDSSLANYLDSCPVAWKEITVRHLLSHTSGIINFTGMPEAKGNFLLQSRTHREILDLFKSKPLESKPGEKYNYNNSGYFLLGLIVEKISGKSLEAYFTDNFFQPLQLKNTGVDNAESLIMNRANGYNQVNDSLFVNTYNINMDNSFAIGGLYSSAPDLLRWASVFDSEKLFDDKTRNEIFTRAKNSTYGLGWIVDTLGKTARSYHDGGITDFSSSLQRVGDYTIIAISNKGSDAGIKVAYDIAGKIFAYPATIRGIQNEMNYLTSIELFGLISEAKKNLARFRINEKLVNEVAEDLQHHKQALQAVEIYRLNTLLYPKSDTAYLKLGEAYLAIKDPEKARECFTKCLELNPANTTARKLLSN